MDNGRPLLQVTHDEQADARRSNRRQLIGLGIALVVFVLVPVLLMILDLGPS